MSSGWNENSELSFVKTSMHTCKTSLIAHWCRAPPTIFMILTAAMVRRWNHLQFSFFTACNASQSSCRKWTSMDNLVPRQENQTPHCHISKVFTFYLTSSKQVKVSILRPQWQCHFAFCGLGNGSVNDNNQTHNSFRAFLTTPIPTITSPAPPK